MANLWQKFFWRAMHRFCGLDVYVGNQEFC
jgi:hypothetical protein